MSFSSGEIGRYFMQIVVPAKATLLRPQKAGSLAGPFIILQHPAIKSIDHRLLRSFPDRESR
jgi:hypothetical protein